MQRRPFDTRPCASFGDASVVGLHSALVALSSRARQYHARARLAQLQASLRVSSVRSSV
jgi:hypothetical protein